MLLFFLLGAKEEGKSPSLFVESDNGVTVHEVKVQLVAHQLSDVVDFVFDHCWPEETSEKVGSGEINKRRGRRRRKKEMK